MKLSICTLHAHPPKLMHFANICYSLVSYPELQSDFTTQIKMLPVLQMSLFGKNMLKDGNNRMMALYLLNLSFLSPSNFITLGEILCSPF